MEAFGAGWPSCPLWTWAAHLEELLRCWKWSTEHDK